MEVNPTVDDAAALEVTEVPTAPDTETVLSNLSGSINVSEPLMEAVVTITGVDGQQTIDVKQTAAFSSTSRRVATKSYFLASIYLIRWWV